MSAANVKILVLYESQTGNVEQMARLVAEGAREVECTEVRIKKVAADGPDRATPEDVLWADGIAVGSPTNMGMRRWKMKKFWDEEMASHWMKLDGRIGCAFSAAGGWENALLNGRPPTFPATSCRTR